MLYDVVRHSFIIRGNEATVNCLVKIRIISSIFILIIDTLLLFIIIIILLYILEYNCMQKNS